MACIHGEPIRRSIPSQIRTAYPRTSRVFEDPPQGLASIEAVYVARRILGDDDPSLLDGYHWKQAFLANLATSEAR
jgi:pre-rRNA-processing protein TSR3